MSAMLAFCNEHYGAKTTSQYSTFFEMGHAIDNGIPIVGVSLTTGG